MAHKDTDNKINEAIDAIDAERLEGTVNLNSDTDHESIASTLSDSEGDDPNAQEEDDVKVKPEKKEAKRKNVKIPKGPKKPLKKKIIIGASCLVGAFAVFYFVTSPNNPISGPVTSIPNASKWELFGRGEQKAKKIEPMVTLSQFEHAMQQFRAEIYERVNTVPTEAQLNELRNQIGSIQQLQNQQKALIASLMSKADRPVSTSNVIDNSIYESQLLTLRRELDQLNEYTGELSDKTAKLDKTSVKVAELVNSNWANHLRIKTLENKFKESSSSTSTRMPDENTVEVNTLKKPEKITWNSSHAWVIKIASSRFTQIYNKNTGKHLRVFDGVEIPNCGIVLDIDVAARKISTQHCTIGRG